MTTLIIDTTLFMHLDDIANERNDDSFMLLRENFDINHLSADLYIKGYNVNGLVIKTYDSLNGENTFTLKLKAEHHLIGEFNLNNYTTHESLLDDILRKVD